MKKVLVTGAAGFIGFHLTKALLAEGHHVIGVDNLNDYYDPKLKTDRLENISTFVREHNLEQFYEFRKLDISNNKGITEFFKEHIFHLVINLAAQAGVRYSLDNPKAYIESNLVGFANILECCRHSKIEHLVFASSSSVYGMNKRQPFSTSDNTDFPISLYAATKKSNELLAYSYSHLYQIPATGLRFFTVYGPYGRPDMAYYKFTKAIQEGSPIDVYNNGDMWRDFTYIDDIVKGILRLISRPPAPTTNAISNSNAPFKIYNIGNNSPVSLREFISAIEIAMGKKAVENLLPMQPGDVPSTFADIDSLIADFDFTPTTSIHDGISKFVGWYKKNTS